MQNERPIGVTIIAVIFACLGGLTTFMLFFTIVDSLTIFGVKSLLINTAYSLIGFIIYGCVPLSFYITGVGLFDGREWSRILASLVIPILLFVYFTNVACNEASISTGIPKTFILDLLTVKKDIFIIFFLKYSICVFPVVFYLNRPGVKTYFNDESLDETKNGVN